jgi:uncharacterized HhH-GPD family protein
VPAALYLTPDDDANRLLAHNPLATLIGMLLDQQVPMEWAFTAPKLLEERLDGSLDAATLAAMPVDDVIAIFCAKPALHRFPAAMAKRAHALCVHVVDEYDGHPERVWTEARDGDDWRQHSHAGGLECWNWRGC